MNKLLRNFPMMGKATRPPPETLPTSWFQPCRSFYVFDAPTLLPLRAIELTDFFFLQKMFCLMATSSEKTSLTTLYYPPPFTSLSSLSPSPQFIIFMILTDHLFSILLPLLILSILNHHEIGSCLSILPCTSSHRLCLRCDSLRNI